MRFSSRSRNSSGIALLFTVCALALVSLVSLAVLRRVSLFANLKHEEQVEKVEDEALWQDIGRALQTAGSSLTCTDSKNGEVEVCLKRNNFVAASAAPIVSGKAERPLVNAAALFMHATHCLSSLSLPSTVSPSSVLSARSCTQTPLFARDPLLAFDGNLMLTSFVVPPAVSELAISGGTFIQSVTVSNPLTIVSGGDISVDSLNVTVGTVPILFVSMSGDVIVKRVTGIANISAITPRTAYLVPENVAPHFAGALPQQLSRMILGVSTLRN